MKRGRFSGAFFSDTTMAKANSIPFNLPIMSKGNENDFGRDNGTRKDACRRSVEIELVLEAHKTKQSMD